MRLARTFIATLSITLVMVLAALAVVVTGSGAFAFDRWPTAPASAPQEKVVVIDSPVRQPPKARADARRGAHAERQSGDLLAAAPTVSHPSAAPVPRPFRRSPIRRAPVAPADAPAATTGAPQEDSRTYAWPHAQLPAAEDELPAKQLPEAPEDDDQVRDDAEDVRRAIRPERIDDRD